jgi:hypothetical protein
MPFDWTPNCFFIMIIIRQVRTFETVKRLADSVRGNPKNRKNATARDTWSQGEEVGSILKRR